MTYKLSTLLHDADKIISSNIDPNLGNHEILLFSNKKLQKSSWANDIKLIETQISLHELINASDKQKYISNIWGGICENNSLINIYFFETLAKYISSNKIIFVFLGLDEYFIEENKKIKYGKNYISHATTLIFWPMSNDTYGAYHFNPHGNYGKDNNHFEKYITHYRSSKIKLTEPIDVYVNKILINEINKHLTKKKIIYEDSSKYNYYGVNFQIADNYGLCYIYQMLLFNFICFNKNAMHKICKQNSNTIIRLPSTARLIRRGNWNDLIYLCLNNVLNKNIEKKRKVVKCKKITLENILYEKSFLSETDFIELYETFLQKESLEISKKLLYSFIKTFREEY